MDCDSERFTASKVWERSGGRWVVVSSSTKKKETVQFCVNNLKYMININES